MGLYADWIFPRAMDWVMSGREFREQRAEVLRPCRGEVLEVGFGTGLNLPYYPAEVGRLTILDPAELLPRRVERRIAATRLSVDRHRLSAETLPFDAGRFDYVVSTWTLCTIPNVRQALGEIHRVLKPGGQFVFVEHGRSSDAEVARRQDRWNWLQNVIGQGCHLNRPIAQLVGESDLETVEFLPFRMPGPRMVAEHFRGVAAKR